ncbi:hypothetical protein AC579_9536 [Pseudocercospora musae]|uniref:DUF7924 domain-containing protein n=1 Tax=Pseudocercospora musae TaxID=113226 RepID=A0A139GWG4_9PEZI|nr:hypothetical protein AC579_9536 [Pseudocercospora musae]
MSQSRIGASSRHALASLHISATGTFAMASKHLEVQNIHRVRKRPRSIGIRRSRRLEQAAKQHAIHPVHHLPSPPSEHPLQARKRKFSHDTSHVSVAEPLQKKSRKRKTTGPHHQDEAGSDDQYGLDVRWDEYFGSWPVNIAEQSMSVREPRAVKRSYTPSRSNSYSQRVRDGDSPAAWTRKHEEKMEEVGLFMTADRTQATITDECQRLCDRLLEAEYSMPESPAYHPDRLAKVLRRVRFRNESRVVRDVMPIVVPSPELLHIDGHAEVDNICEAMNAEWTQCDTLCGPRPKPDFVGGISATEFTKEEKEKLQLSHTSACPNLFPENMYFPFLICEVKGSDRPIEEAERQAMHSASIAIRAVIELFRKVSATAEVHQKVLAFSVTHNHSMVMIFAHFATIDGEKTSFYRRLVHLNRFAEDLEFTTWAKAYKIVRAIYEHFAPQHIHRIRSVLSRMRSPTLASFATQLGIDEDSQASILDQSSSQEDGGFKKPSLPSVTRLQEENDNLRNRLLELLKNQQVEASQQREEQHAQRVLIEKQLAQQKEESREQKLMMEKQLAQQKEESREQKLMMEKQLAQQKEESREQKLMMEKQLAQQKEESREQKLMMEKQLAQQKEESREQKLMMEKQLAQQKEESREQKLMMEKQLAQQQDIISLFKTSNAT